MRKVPFKDIDIIEFKTDTTPCVYLNDKKMQMHYKYIKQSNQALSSQLINDGWRRFGYYYSKPICPECSECKSLKVDVQNFTFTKSAKRVIKKNQKTKIVVQKPTFSTKHLNIYKKYHEHQSIHKGWDIFDLDEDSYQDLYLKGSNEFGKEVLYFVEDKLVGVDLIDILEDGISTIYFYYDPTYSHLSLGRYSIYKEIEMAKEMELKWVYLGYFVEDCPSLSYKDNYKPNEKIELDHLKK